jgi:ribosomal protein S27E
MSGTIYSITCPNCNETVYVKQAVQQARMKCNHCGARFVGSTQGEIQQPATPHAAPQAAPQAASRPHAPRRTHLQKKRQMHIRRKTPWAAIIICCVCVLGLIGAGVAMFNKAGSNERDIATVEADKKAKVLRQKKKFTIVAQAASPLGEEAVVSPPYVASLPGANPGEPISVTTKNCVPIQGEAEESLFLVGD